ncbi:MAG: PQQ-dependent sugar dehydrogenase [Candidatus Nanopelagicales bacterium]
MRIVLASAVGAGALVLALAPAPGISAAPTLRLVDVGSFVQPTYVTAPRGDRHRLFVVEKAGRIRVVRDGQVLPRPLLDIRPLVSSDGERGLLSMAFAPDYATSHRFYVNYTDTVGDTRIVEYRTSAATPLRAGQPRQLMRIHQPGSNHNGGQLQFGPDGYLYIGMGDGGGTHGDVPNNAQNLSTLLGKMLRIDPHPSATRPYTIPRSNPFVGRSGARPQIWAKGFRNPWRFSFDRATGDLTIADVGENQWEEVDFAQRGAAAGRNFGWHMFEGRQRVAPGNPNRLQFPLLTKSHDRGWCAVTGGYVVRTATLPSLAGRYVYGDFCRPGVRSARLAADGATQDQETGLSVSRLVSFGEDGLGRVYTVSLDGPVSRIAEG